MLLPLVLIDIKRVWWQNYQRLLIWCNIGADVKNGIWAMYGARLGCYLTACTEWDYTQVRDFEYLTDYWTKHVEHIDVENEIKIPICLFSIFNCVFNFFFPHDKRT